MNENTMPYLISTFEVGWWLVFENRVWGFSSSSGSDSQSSPFQMRGFGLLSISSSSCIQPIPIRSQQVNSRERAREYQKNNSSLLVDWSPTSSGTFVIGGVVWKGTLGAWGNLESCSSSTFLRILHQPKIYIKQNVKSTQVGIGNMRFYWKTE